MPKGASIEYPPDMGGIEIVTQSLAVAACGAGYDVTVICFDQSGMSGNSDAGMCIQRYPIRKMLSSQPLSFAYFFAAVCEGRKADIVHLHAPNLLAAFASLFLGSKPKLLVHWHADVLGKGLLGRMVMPLEYLMLRQSAVILTTSQPYADNSLPLRSFLKKNRVVPLGIVSPKIEQEQTKLSPRLTEFIAGRKLVLSVGRLTAYKGFSVLVEAAKLMPDDAAIVIAGAGELSDTLASLIHRNELSGKIMLAGRVTHEELTALYKNATLFCLSSVTRAEAFGVVLIEAMAYGLPIVATNIEGSGVPWVNAHEVSGLNVPPNDAKELAAACTLILNRTDLREKYSFGAKERFLAQFTEALFQKNRCTMVKFCPSSVDEYSPYH